ncbi:MAG: class I mannose-6-phosphate isomerase [Planctomycetaceae bacterium]|jgi:mannose-6-phosphate isomerase|nr:class I mannose-6-phosphate isomerase [Planctomycetaceae bacterium]
MKKNDSILQNTPLYPFRFEPIYKDYLWGGNRLRELFHRPVPDNVAVTAESWEISDHPHGLSVIRNGMLCGFTLRDILLNHPQKLFGADYLNPNILPKRFPLILKYLDAAQPLSVQVHPDHVLAQKLAFDDWGKTEAWVVVEAEPDSVIYIGTRQSYSFQEQEQLIRNGHWDLLLNQINVRSGDCFFIPPGTLHALGAGILVAEIQTSSDITFRMFDWNRLDHDGKPRELNIEEGLRALRVQELPVTVQVPVKTEDIHCERLIIDKSFTVNRWILNEQIIWYNDHRCHLWTVLEGSLIISFTAGRRMQIMKNSERETDPDAIEILQRGDSILIPAVCRDLQCIPENNHAVFLDVIPGEF